MFRDLIIAESDEQGVNLDILTHGTTVEFNLKRGLNVIILPFANDVNVYPFDVSVKLKPTDDVMAILKIQKKIVYTTLYGGVTPWDFIPVTDDMRAIIGYIDGTGTPNSRSLRLNSRRERPLITNAEIEEIYQFDNEAIMFGSQSDTYLLDVMSFNFGLTNCFPVIKYNVWCI